MRSIKPSIMLPTSPRTGVKAYNGRNWPHQGLSLTNPPILPKCSLSAEVYDSYARPIIAIKAKHFYQKMHSCRALAPGRSEVVSGFSVFG
ncbi:Uncharacterised protein [Mycobacteroides abscessus subsp. bolletii]|nr:Uncharacterised protein [Mycobacteroides abscessus subsp. bolletii]SKH05326.1 Uncharacterised protein [Mycobacteroides abscessus subsp. bolletii]SKH94753.1 Uncharacterised protein [Mycobacteroides abscessus subsp. bolletii]SKH95518.1 Uncharacterised protein [Mycobacteroides abscessus subsp. bolletii]SKH98654.1 Uncharacterised protein [Mycobacteroides abscessus subsp. bolletii]